MALQNFKKDSTGAAVVVQPDVLVSGTLGALNASVELVLSVDGSATFQLASTSTLVGTIQFQGTVNGTDWGAVNGTVSGTNTPTPTHVNPAPGAIFRLTPAGLARVRVIVTAYTSGSAGVAGLATPLSNGIYANQRLPVSTSPRAEKTMQIVHSGRLTVAATADAATAGRLWLINPVGSAVTLALRRAELITVPTAATAFPSAPRITLERVTFTGTASGATIPPAVRDSSEQAAVGSVRTASTGLVLTAGATAYGFAIAPVLTAVGAAVPVVQEWEPSETGQLILRAGQGVVVRQPDAGTTADTRAFWVNLSWDEY